MVLDMYSVYKHTTPSGKVYIGITSKNPKRRWDGRYRSNYHFSNAIQKYGWDSIKHEILYEGLTKEEAESKEIELIAKYDSTNPNKGYNIASGGHSNSGYHHSDDVKKKISNSLRGQEYTERRRKNMSISSKRKWKNEEYRKRMIDVHKGLQSGKKHSMSKAVIQYSMDGKFIRSFGSMGEAQRITGIQHQQISDCCRGKQASCHGYVWRFKE